MLKRLLVMLSMFCVIASAAAAQEDGVTVDPGSPSGKEYALPVDRARRQAAKPTTSRSDPRPTPLFGEGVGDDVKPSDVQAKKAPARTGGGATPSNQADAGPAIEPRSPQARAAAPQGGLGFAAGIAGGAAILLIGGLLGLWLRRRATT